MQTGIPDDFFADSWAGTCRRMVTSALFLSISCWILLSRPASCRTQNAVVFLEEDMSCMPSQIGQDDVVCPDQYPGRRLYLLVGQVARSPAVRFPNADQLFAVNIDLQSD